jgi:hypothetical protein
VFSGVNANKINIGRVEQHTYVSGPLLGRSRYRDEIAPLLSRFASLFVGREDDIAKIVSFR